MTTHTAMSGAEMVIQAFLDNGVDTVFGYPGGAILPVYHELEDPKRKNAIRHILVRHEQGAIHEAEGYARSTGKVGVVIVTSGPGLTNTVTGLQDARADSIPIVVLSGQVPSHLIGTDAFQECDATGLTRPCTKHNYLVRNVAELSRILHEAFHVARSGRPGPVHVDLPKDVQFATGTYLGLDAFPPGKWRHQPTLDGDSASIAEAVSLMHRAKRPIIYSGGGVINAGPRASTLLRELVSLTDAPITSTLMGLGAFPASRPEWLGMLGMHGSYEANMAMHECDVMLCVGARFDDRITGKLSEFSPKSKKIHIDIDASSIQKIVRADVSIVGDCARVLDAMIACWKVRGLERRDLSAWWEQIQGWQAKESFAYELSSDGTIMPQYAIRRLSELTHGRDTYITTDVGQHQMWVAQHFPFEEPNRLMTSGGLGTMGYGLPAAVGVQVAHPNALVVAISGDASIQMMAQELSTAVQYGLPIKVLILNNRYMGMVQQWQDLLHDGRHAHSYVDAMPDFAMLAKAYGGSGVRCEKLDELDTAIRQMIAYPGPFVLDCAVANIGCFPMIPSGNAHNDMLLRQPETAGTKIDKALV